MMHRVVVVVFVLAATCTARRCSNPPPGIEKQRRGIDITKLDLLPLDFNQPDGFLRPIFDYTCNDGKQWISSTNKVYDLPDQVWDISLIPDRWSNPNTQIFKNFHKVKDSMASGLGFRLNLINGAFSDSHSYKTNQETISKASKYIEEVSSYSYTLKVDLLMPWSLNININKSVNHYVDRFLPSNLNDNSVHGCFMFIREFGTHVFQSAKFGGIVKLHLETASDYYKGKSNRDVEMQAEASFMNILSLKGTYQQRKTKVDETFKMKTSQTLRYYGGEQNLIDGNGNSKWQPTVNTNPWLFTGELIPISEFIKDNKKRAAMEKAVVAHVNKAYLRDMVRILEIVKSKITVGRTQIMGLLERVKKTLSLVIPKQNIIDSLSREMDNDLIVPWWFTKEIYLCFRWYPEHDDRQCSGPPGHYCVKPGDMTAYYMDDTNSRDGGCKMSWGIFPVTYFQPSWLKKLQLCYRWYGDGNVTQCGGGAPSEICASAGRYTQYYSDDTDRRSGGCLMSWRLKVPANAPVWMKNAKLCFYWYPDGDAGQCGGDPSLSQHLCAIVNTWTRYYKDDTDDRFGGCRMSWGINLQNVLGNYFGLDASQTLTLKYLHTM